MRIGYGMDVHRLVQGRRLILCGVEIPYTLGLEGHSDADVATHALMDALLGAAALGDIGRLFPDSSDRYLDADSIVLLREVCALVQSRGYRVGNADLTIVAQAPKIAPYVEKMRTRLAQAMGIPLDDVSVKATTTEKLGFEGEGRGITAHCVCLIEGEGHSA